MNGEDIKDRNKEHPGADSSDDVEGEEDGETGPKQR